jgi:hypothetical protein
MDSIYFFIIIFAGLFVPGFFLALHFDDVAQEQREKCHNILEAGNGTYALFYRGGMVSAEPKCQIVTVIQEEKRTVEEVIIK